MGVIPIICKKNFSSCAFNKLFILNSFSDKYNSSTIVRKVYILEGSDLIMNKRVYFVDGNQREFVKYFKDKSGLSWSDASAKLKINENTLSKAYRFGTCNIPYVLFKQILFLINESEEKVSEKFNIQLIEEQEIIGRKMFGERKKILKPINITFENKDLNLDISDINFSKPDLEKGIKIPLRMSPLLAEEIGMHYGDGFLSARKYDYRLKGNPNDEKEYYLNYIKPLFKSLYNIKINPKDFEASFGFELYSKAFWEFKTKVLKIRPGNKRNIRFPEALKVKDEKILAAFIRGLFDTDGSVSFISKYGYKNYYPSISIGLISKEFISEVAEILEMFGLEPRVYFNERYGIIALYGTETLERYEKIIGWSSPKNLNKVAEWRRRYPQLNKMAVVV